MISQKRAEVRSRSNIVIPSFNTSFLLGVDSLIHVAAPSYIGGLGTAEIIKGGVDGTLNILKYAIAAGVRKIFHTSSYAALCKCAYYTLLYSINSLFDDQ